MTAKADFVARVRNEMRKATALFPASVAERSSYPRQLADAVRREIAERWPTTSWTTSSCQCAEVESFQRRTNLRQLV